MWYTWSMDKRQEIKNYLEQCDIDGVRPTIREIGRAVGIKSTSHVHYHLQRLGLESYRKYPKIFSTNTREIRNEIIRLLGSKCAKCGFSDTRALQIDHVYNNGSKERNAMGQRGMYIKMYIEIKSGNTYNYQVLCANCNWIKRYDQE